MALLGVTEGIVERFSPIFDPKGRQRDLKNVA